MNSDDIFTACNRGQNRDALATEARARLQNDQELATSRGITDIEAWVQGASVQTLCDLLGVEDTLKNLMTQESVVVPVIMQIGELETLVDFAVFFMQPDLFDKILGGYYDTGDGFMIPYDDLVGVITVGGFDQFGITFPEDGPVPEHIANLQPQTKNEEAQKQRLMNEWLAQKKPRRNPIFFKWVINTPAKAKYWSTEVFTKQSQKDGWAALGDTVRDLQTETEREQAQELWAKSLGHRPLGLPDILQELTNPEYVSEIELRDQLWGVTPFEMWEDYTWEQAEDFLIDNQILQPNAMHRPLSLKVLETMLAQARDNAGNIVAETEKAATTYMFLARENGVLLPDPELAIRHSWNVNIARQFVRDRVKEYAPTDSNYEHILGLNDDLIYRYVMPWLYARSENTDNWDELGSEYLVAAVSQAGHGYVIQNLSDPPVDVQMAAVRNDPINVMYIQNPAEEVLMQIVKGFPDYPETQWPPNPLIMRFVRNVPEAVRIECYKMGVAPSNELFAWSDGEQILAVQQRSDNIQLILEPCMRAQIMAVTAAAENLLRINGQIYQNVLQMALLKMPQLARHFDEVPYIVQDAMVRDNPKNILQLKNPGGPMQMYVVRQNVENIKFIRNPAPGVTVAVRSWYRNKGEPVPEVLGYSVKMPVQVAQLHQAIESGDEIMFTDVLTETVEPSAEFMRVALGDSPGFLPWFPNVPEDLQTELCSRFEFVLSLIMHPAESAIHSAVNKNAFNFYRNWYKVEANQFWFVENFGANLALLINHASPAVQRTVVTQNPTYIAMYPYALDEVKMAALQSRNLPMQGDDVPICILPLIHNPTDEMKEIAVQINYRNIGFIKDPSPRTQLLAMRTNAKAVQLISNVDLAAFQEAEQTNPEVRRFLSDAQREELLNQQEAQVDNEMLQDAEEEQRRARQAEVEAAALAARRVAEQIEQEHAQQAEVEAAARRRVEEQEEARLRQQAQEAQDFAMGVALQEGEDRAMAVQAEQLEMAQPQVARLARQGLWRAGDGTGRVRRVPTLHGAHTRGTSCGTSCEAEAGGRGAAPGAARPAGAGGSGQGSGAGLAGVRGPGSGRRTGADPGDQGRAQTGLQEEGSVPVALDQAAEEAHQETGGACKGAGAAGSGHCRARKAGRGAAHAGHAEHAGPPRVWQVQRAQPRRPAAQNPAGTTDAQPSGIK